MNKKSMLIIAIYAIFNLLLCVDFTENVISGLTPIERSTAAWGDYDKDGDLDLLITGSLGGSYPEEPTAAVTKLYQNNGGDNFSEVTTHNIPQILGRFDCVDYDNDGDLDIALTGRTVVNESITKVYSNDGNGIFTDIGAVFDVLPSEGNNSNVAWGDYDNDGDLDLLVTGSNNQKAIVTKLYKNHSGIFTDSGVLIPDIMNATTVWGDYDNDGDLDILMTGVDASGKVSKIIKNDGVNSQGQYIFTDINAGLIGVAGNMSQSAAWGDYDNDGDLDVLLTGLKNPIDDIERGVTILYRNDTGDKFNAVCTFTDDTFVGYSSVAFGDCDNNGYLDFITTGCIYPAWVDFTKLYVYTGNNYAYSQPFRSSRIGTIAWSDFDKDGDLDFWLNGCDGIEYDESITFSEISKNLTAENDLHINTPPNPPTNLYSSLNGNDVTLHWDKSTDTETPQNGLSYNLYIGTASKSCNILNPMSSVPDGLRKVSKRGNVDQNTSWTIKNLPDGIYYYSVQAIDHGFAGSEFSPECIFVKGECTLPEKDIINMVANTEIRLLKGAHLNVSPNSLITILSESKLILEEDSELAIEDSATVKLNSNSQTECFLNSLITVNGGAFNAYESSITGFELWQGIITEAGSSVILANSIVENAETGLYATAANVSISYSKFTDCVNGVNLVNCNDLNSRSFTLFGNNFTGLNTGTGIYLTISDGNLRSNTIENFTEGVRFVLSSSIVTKNNIWHNSKFGIVSSGSNAIPFLGNYEKVPGLNNNIINNGPVTPPHISPFPSAQIGIIPIGNVFLKDGMNNIFSGATDTVPVVPCISISGISPIPEDQYVLIDATGNYWGALEDLVTADFFSLRYPYALIYKPCSDVPFILGETYSSNGSPDTETIILSNAVLLEDKENYTASIKQYEHIIDRYEDTPEYYVALARLPYVYLKAGIDTESLIQTFDDGIESDKVTNKKFLKEMKIATHIKGKKYDTAIALAEEMKSEAQCEEEILLAEIDIAVCNIMKESEGKGGNKKEASEVLNNLLSKLYGDDVKSEPARITDNILPEASELFQNYPNPFNPVTQIKFALAKTSDIKLSVYNINGQLVFELANGIKNAGCHSVDFDGSKLNSGIYYYTLEVDGRAITKKMVLTK